MNVSYIRRGEGKELVFFHGYGANKECFLPQINYFSSFFKTTAFDFLGFGKSDALSSPFSVGDYAQSAREFLNSLDIKNPSVIAHSFGARVAVKMAACGYKFDKMILTGAAGIIDNRGAAYKIKVLSYRLAKRFSKMYAESKFGSPEYRNLSPVMKESYKKIVNEDLRLASSKIECKVLLMVGENDETTPLKQAKVYNSFIPDSRICIMENCGHFAFLDDPMKFNLLAEEFLLDL